MLTGKAGTSQCGYLLSIIIKHTIDGQGCLSGSVAKTIEG
jgi:hypothetical protein